MTKLDVIIPAYNYAERLPAAIHSALSCQSVERVIVVDDGSTDTTPQVLDQLARQQNRLTVITQENAGPAAARNRGIDASTSDWLMFLDADDELLPEGVDEACGLLVSSGKKLLLSAAVSQHQEKREYRPIFPEEKKMPNNWFYAFLNKQVSISHGRFIAHKSCFLELRYPEDFTGQEDLPVYGILLACYEPVLCRQATVCIQHHEKSLRRNVENALRNESRVVDALFDHPLLPVSYRQYRNAFHAARCFSIFRTLAKAGDPRAGEYFLKAIRLQGWSWKSVQSLAKYARWKIRGKA